ncbi:MAG TPA: Rpn family recombination-promoting nuclease/putative transposase [Thermoanaerobaculia bacterium]|nr:Rpn family recombination-promoting nuclease/putative transposase [Thermoanaerobaculia bacterium]
MPEHDNGYKLLFAYPRLVEDLLRGYVQEAWVEQLDLSTLERVSGSFVNDDLRERHNGVPAGDGDLPGGGARPVAPASRLAPAG